MELTGHLHAPQKSNGLVNLHAILIWRRCHDIDEYIQKIYRIFWVQIKWLTNYFQKLNPVTDFGPPIYPWSTGWNEEKQKREKVVVGLRAAEEASLGPWSTGSLSFNRREREVNAALWTQPHAVPSTLGTTSPNPSVESQGSNSPLGTGKPVS